MVVRNLTDNRIKEEARHLQVKGHFPIPVELVEEIQQKEAFSPRSVVFSLIEVTGGGHP